MSVPSGNGGMFLGCQPSPLTLVQLSGTSTEMSPVASRTTRPRAGVGDGDVPCGVGEGVAVALPVAVGETVGEAEERGVAGTVAVAAGWPLEVGEAFCAAREEARAAAAVECVPQPDKVAIRTAAATTAKPAIAAAAILGGRLRVRGLAC